MPVPKVIAGGFQEPITGSLENEIVCHLMFLGALGTTFRDLLTSALRLWGGHRLVASVATVGPIELTKGVPGAHPGSTFGTPPARCSGAPDVI